MAYNGGVIYGEHGSLIGIGGAILANNNCGGAPYLDDSMVHLIGQLRDRLATKVGRPHFVTNDRCDNVRCPPLRFFCA